MTSRHKTILVVGVIAVLVVLVLMYMPLLPDAGVH